MSLFRTKTNQPHPIPPRRITRIMSQHRRRHPPSSSSPCPSSCSGPGASAWSCRPCTRRRTARRSPAARRPAPPSTASPCPSAAPWTCRRWPARAPAAAAAGAGRGMRLLSPPRSRRPGFLWPLLGGRRQRWAGRRIASSASGRWSRGLCLSGCRRARRAWRRTR